jgi:hypothetical protein
MDGLTKAVNMAIDAMRQTRRLYGIPDTHLLASAEKRLADAMDQVEDQVKKPKTIRCTWCGKARRPNAYAGDFTFPGLIDICQWCRGVEARRNGTARKPLQGEKKGGTVFEL